MLRLTGEPRDIRLPPAVREIAVPSPGPIGRKERDHVLEDEVDRHGSVPPLPARRAGFQVPARAAYTMQGVRAGVPDVRTRLSSLPRVRRQSQGLARDARP